ncbi:MAG TPA: SGNH hydrolase domain-containing protein, partial [Kiloniellales bacterium]|nr:SGNH hydrolase domain-containing protein [Kiloniellales bacterium]
SWRYVERPFRRRGQQGLSRARLGVAIGGAAALLLSASVAIRTSEGAPERLPLQALRYLSAKADHLDEVGDCSGADLSQTSLPCSLGEEGKPVRVLLWGDSHARVLGGAVDRLADAVDFGGIGLVEGGCPPLVGVDRSDEPGVCLDFGERVIEYVNENDIDVVVLHARWPMYVEGRRYGFEDGTVPLNGKDGAALVHDKLGQLIEYLEVRDIDVVLIGSVPEAGFNVPDTLALATLLDRRQKTFSLDRQAVDARQRRTSIMLRDLAGRYRVPLIDPIAALCDFESCYLEKDGLSLYADEDHLSREGVALLEPLLAPLRLELEKAAWRGGLEGRK